MAKLWQRFLAWRNDSTAALRSVEKRDFVWSADADEDALVALRMKQADEGGGGGA